MFQIFYSFNFLVDNFSAFDCNYFTSYTMHLLFDEPDFQFYNIFVY